ncbi:hypothetical protein H7H82_17210 [Mycobacterium heidelbergense]|nr:hypothetical protein [Mycobacterium heidelbergense]
MTSAETAVATAAGEPGKPGEPAAAVPGAAGEPAAAVPGAAGEPAATVRSGPEPAARRPADDRGQG